MPSGVAGIQYGLPPFPPPLDCAATDGRERQPRRSGQPGNCGSKNIGGANTRFRLEPTINVTDQVRVHSQIDVLDNTIMGSTPDSLAGIQGYNRPPLDRQPDRHARQRARGFVATNQDPPGGRAERLRLQHPRQARLGGGGHRVRIAPLRPHALALGPRHLLQPGQPAQTATSAPPSTGSWDLTTIYGHQLAAAWDLGAQGPTTQQLTLGRNDPSGYPYDLSQNDDVFQLMGGDHAHRQPGDAARARRSRRHRLQLRRAVRLPEPGHASWTRGTATTRSPPTNGPQPQTPSELPHGHLLRRRTPSRPTSGSSCTTRR